MLEDNICSTTQTVMIMNQLTEGNKSPRKQPFESKEGQNRNWKRSCDQSQKRRETSWFTPLNVSYERLLLIIRDLLEFKWPVPIQMNPS